MSNQIKGGRKPIGSKPAEVVFNDSMFGDSISIPQEYRDDAAARGMELRLVDGKNLAAFGGYHKNQWVAYRVPKSTSAIVETTQSFKFGNDPDGIVRRGSLILAERPVTIGDAHRFRLKQKTESQSRTHHDKAVDGIKQSFKEGRVSARVVTGEED